jgi:hypothetical protein
LVDGFVDDGWWLRFLTFKQIWPLVKFKLKYQGKNVILSQLNLYSQSVLVTYSAHHPTHRRTHSRRGNVIDIHILETRKNFPSLLFLFVHTHDHAQPEGMSWTSVVHTQVRNSFPQPYSCPSTHRRTHSQREY